MQKKTINELEKKLRQKKLDNESELIKEIEELKEYKEKYEELLKEKKDNEEIYADKPYLETEEEAAEIIADFNEKIKEKKDNNCKKDAESLLKNAEKDLLDRIVAGNEYITKNKIIKFLKGIISGDINDSNKIKEYFIKLENIRLILNNESNKSNNIKKYIKYLNNIKNILSISDKFYIPSLSSSLSSSSSSPIKGDKKTSGKGLNITALSILLSKLNINSSKKLISDMKQLINYLYDNKQIIKQVYNILIKAITYKNDS